MFPGKPTASTLFCINTKVILRKGKLGFFGKYCNHVRDGKLSSSDNFSFSVALYNTNVLIQFRNPIKKYCN